MVDHPETPDTREWWLVEPKHDQENAFAQTWVAHHPAQLWAARGHPVVHVVPAARLSDLETRLREAVEAEPELTDDMPDDMWRVMNSGDRDAVTHALRTIVRLTKRDILARAISETP